jgi:hypothetical protein
MTGDIPVNGVLFNRADMQALPGHGNISGLRGGAAGLGGMLPAAPAMGSDPFGAPPPPPVLEKPLALPTAADPFSAPAAAAPPAAGEPMARPEEAAKEMQDGRSLERKEDITLAQTVASLRPTGRRALGIDLPLDGTVHHFSKLKDHAVLEIEIQSPAPA